MAVRTAFREGLQAVLATALSTPDRPVAFVGGRLEGPQEERDIGCVWWEGKRPFARDGNVEEDYYRVRLFKLFRQEQGDTTRRNITGLEDAAEALEAALKANLMSVGHWFYNVTEITVDYGVQVVEAQLVAYDRNRSSAGG